jgi:hypothetical protein
MNFDLQGTLKFDEFDNLNTRGMSDAAYEKLIDLESPSGSRTCCSFWYRARLYYMLIIPIADE